MRPDDVCPDCEAEKSQIDLVETLKRALTMAIKAGDELKGELDEARGIAEEYRDSLTMGDPEPLPWED